MRRPWRRPCGTGRPCRRRGPTPPEEWAEFAEAARQHLKGKAEYDFAYAVALRGFTPLELATGELSPGSELNLVTGRVKRPLRSTLDAETEEQARQVLRGLRERNLTLFASLQQALELGSVGRWTSQARTVHEAIREGSMRIEAHDRERQAAVAEEQQKPRLTVRFAFKAMGREYPQGEFRVGPEEAESLESWKVRMESQMKERGWDAPSGYSPGSWPPFSLEGGD